MRDILWVDLNATHAYRWSDLTESERSRSEKFKKTRWHLRNFLAKKLKVAPIEVGLQISDAGKPSLLNTPFHFNVSHSGKWFAIAFDNTPVGFDIEEIKRREHIEGIIERTSPHALNSWKSSSQSLDYFYKVWTFYESYTKALGSKILKVTGMTWIPKEDSDRVETEDGWVIQVTKGPEGYAAAVCRLRN